MRNPWYWVAIVFLVVAIVLLLISLAYPHDAPSGWSYPTFCCSKSDCRPVKCDALVETREGIRFGVTIFKSDQVKASGDKQCHVCIGYTNDSDGRPTTYPHCVFVQPTM